MTHEYSPDPTPVGAENAPEAAPAHFGPPTTVNSRRRRTPQRGSAFARVTSRGPVSGRSAGGGLAGENLDGSLVNGSLADGRSRRPGPSTRRRPLAFFGDSRGLTLLGAVLLAATIGTIGGLSAGANSWVGTTFQACFIGGCILAAILVHREDLLTVAFMPPLLFVATATAIGVGQALIASKAVFNRATFQVGYAMSYGARTMWEATIATAVVVLVMFLIRGRRQVVANRRALPSYAPMTVDSEPQPTARPSADPQGPYVPGPN